MKLKELTVKLTVFALALLFVSGIGSTAFGAMDETRTTVTANEKVSRFIPGCESWIPRFSVLRISQKR